MTQLSHLDPLAEIACTLPPDEAASRVTALQALISGRIRDVDRAGERLRIRMDRAGETDLEARVTEWAAAEKRCCAFLGFAVESERDTVTLEIEAPSRAVRMLDGIGWLIRGASESRP